MGCADSWQAGAVHSAIMISENRPLAFRESGSAEAPYSIFYAYVGS